MQHSDLKRLVRTGMIVASGDHGETSLETAIVLLQDHNGRCGLAKWVCWRRSLANRSLSVNITREKGQNGMIYIIREIMGWILRCWSANFGNKEICM